jgi:hypothetical protein
VRTPTIRPDEGPPSIEGVGHVWRRTFHVAIDDVVVQPHQAFAAWRAASAGLLPVGSELSAGEDTATFMLPDGSSHHGTITASAISADGQVIVELTLVTRAREPRTELALVLGRAHDDDFVWTRTLRAMATELASAAAVTTSRVHLGRPRRRQRPRA